MLSTGGRAMHCQAALQQNTAASLLCNTVATSVCHAEQLFLRHQSVGKALCLLPMTRQHSQVRLGNRAAGACS